MEFTSLKAADIFCFYISASTLQFYVFFCFLIIMFHCVVLLIQYPLPFPTWYVFFFCNINIFHYLFKYLSVFSFKQNKYKVVSKVGIAPITNFTCAYIQCFFFCFSFDVYSSAFSLLIGFSIVGYQVKKFQKSGPLFTSCWLPTKCLLIVIISRHFVNFYLSFSFII